MAMNSVSVRNGCAPISNSADVVVGGQRRALGVVERAARWTASPAVQLRMRLACSASHHATVAARVLAVALDELGVAVDGEQELVQQVLAHAGLRSGTR